ncbi:hypothetical protein V2J09_007720 [Rumex salicifolius]
MAGKKPLVVIYWLVIVMELLGGYVIYGTPTDIECLKTIQRSVIDPFKYLANSWNFSNTTEGSICRFIGIECWHQEESRVLNIKLQDMGLKGSFPTGFEKCSSMTGLDLSGNEFNGSIPSNISRILPYVTTLDLSDNNFSGGIPLDLVNCTFLNTLDLNHNRFSGQIPMQLVQLSRLKDFNVAYNNLYGQIPPFSHNNFGGIYDNNPGLCGSPLPLCPGSPKKSINGIIAGAVAGGVALVIILMGIGMFYSSKRTAVRKKQDDPEGNRWAKNMKGTKACKVSMFENVVSEMRLSDLMKATNSFSNTNIIGKGSKGVMYKATLPDGTDLMVKRLQDSQRTEKEFLSEMKTLGSVKHKNLLPLLGFCMAKKERFLVYRYMANGNLFDQLHPADPEADNPPMEWPTRLKIAIGGARGLAWLHHSCNPRIIHRNISSKCILLDEEFEAQLSEFGLARLMNPVDTHLSTFVNGEFGDLGYVAPEYLRTLTATPKGDVYSFGVVLLELITGERATHIKNAPESFKGSLVEWIEQLSSTNEVRSAICQSLVGQGVDDELNQFLKVACNCVNPTAKERPTMFEVLQFLRAIGEKYQFTADDDIMTMPSDLGDADFPDELIVARDPSSLK